MIVARQIPREGERDGPRKIAVLSVSAAKGEYLPRLATSVSVNNDDFKLIYCCQGLTLINGRHVFLPTNTAFEGFV